MKVLRFLTAGSVDDGKSTLIGRLFYDSGKITDDQLEAMNLASQKQGNEHLNLALFTDGLKAEREQGITIDVAYRYFESHARKFILADSPGHLEYTRNMVTAASQSDAAMILIDVEKGVTEQTKRHAWICQWLGVHHIAFCVNKMDRVAYSENAFVRIKTEMEEWAKSISSSLQLHFIPMSALLGEGVIRRAETLNWYAGPTLLEWMNGLEFSGYHGDSRVRFSVQMMIHPKHAVDFEYRGYAGKLNHGNLKVGDELQVARTGAVVRIAVIEKFGVKIDRASAGDLVTLLFEQKLDLSRGDLLFGRKVPPAASKNWDVEMCFLHSKPVPVSSHFFARIDTFESRALLTNVEEQFDFFGLSWVNFSDSQVRPNQILKARLQFQNELFADCYGEFSGSGRMVLILDPGFDTAAAVLLKKPF